MPRLMLATASLLLVAVGILHAEIGPIPGTQAIGPAFENADVVCKCYVQSVDIAEQPMGTSGIDKIRHRAKATVEIQDLYKSDGSPNRTIFVEFSVTEQNGRAIVGSRRLSNGETVVLFLKKGTAGAYSFSDPFFAATPISTLPQLSGELGLSKLRSALSASIKRSQNGDTIRALQLLQGFESLDQESFSSVGTLCASDQSEIALTAFGVLLKTRTPESVERLKVYLQTHNGNDQSFALVSIGSELAQVSNPKALPSIEVLSGSKYVPIQFGAMDAMRLMKNSQSIPTLISRLDDQNATVQYSAVITLAEILRKIDKDYAPTMNMFDARPQYYVGLWKQWWDEEGKAQYRTTSAH
jgi:hypothetical protein